MNNDKPLQLFQHRPYHPLPTDSSVCHPLVLVSTQQMLQVAITHANFSYNTLCNLNFSMYNNTLDEP